MGTIPSFFEISIKPIKINVFPSKKPTDFNQNVILSIIVQGINETRATFEIHRTFDWFGNGNSGIISENQKLKVSYQNLKVLLFIISLMAFNIK